MAPTSLLVMEFASIKSCARAHKWVSTFQAHENDMVDVIKYETILWFPRKLHGLATRTSKHLAIAAGTS